VYTLVTLLWGCWALVTLLFHLDGALGTKVNYRMLLRQI